MPPTDAELIAAARTDAAAFRALYDRYAARVLGFHVRRTGDADAAHDLTAETFAQAEGTDWRCYIGRAAVEQQIIGAGFLGEYAPEPSVG